MRLFSIILWAALLITALGFLFTSYSSWPEQVALNFDGSGQARNLVSKETAFRFHFWFLIGINGFLLAIAAMIRSIPPGLLNMPYKDYWLANDERREEGIGRITAVVFLAMSMINGISFLSQQVILNYHNISVLLPLSVGQLMVAILVMVISFLIGIFLYMRP